VAEDRLDRQSATNALLTFADPRKQHLRVWAPGKLDQLRPHVLLQRPSAERSPGGKLVASLIGYIPNRDSSSHGIIMQLAAAEPQPVVAGHQLVLTSPGGVLRNNLRWRVFDSAALSIGLAGPHAARAADTPQPASLLRGSERPRRFSG
jgi:hypothetical protein